MISIPVPRRAALALVAGLAVISGCGDANPMFSLGDDPADVESAVVPIAAADRSGMTVGDIVVLPDDHKLVGSRGEEVDGFDTVGDGRYEAVESGTYEVVAYQQVPCGGPVDAYPSYTIEVRAAGEPTDGDRPAGLVSPRSVVAVDAIACG
ncbi:MAG: hypothetical protein ACK5OX_09495 [Desertimonas sp.]